MRHPAVPIVLALLAGCAAGLAAAPSAAAASAAVCLATFVAVVCVWCGTVAIGAAATCLAFATAGAALSSSTHQHALQPALRADVAACLGAPVGDATSPPLTLVGQLASDAAVSATGVRIVLDVESLSCDVGVRPTRGRVALSVSGETGLEHVGEWRAGRTVRVPALLRRQARYFDPGVPDFERASLRRGVALVGSVKSPQLVDLVARGTWAHEWAAQTRAWVRRVVDRDVGRASERSAAIVRAVLIGDRNNLDDETQERMQAAGSYHVLAISGGNIAILAGVLLGILRLVGCPSRARDGITAAALVGYAAIVGGGPSVVRATTMATVVLVGRALWHRGGVVNGLAVALGLGLAANPLVLFDPGAWLTYGATGALILAGHLAGPAVARLWPPFGAAVAVCAASLAVELALFPVGAFVFSRVTAAGLVVNLAAVPLMVVVQVAAMVLLAVSSLPDVAAPVGAVVHAGAWALVECGRVVDVLPWLARRLPPPGVAVMVSYYAVWLVWCVGLGRRGTVWKVCRAAALGAAALTGVWMVAAPDVPSSRPAHGVRLTVLDVGQGDATLVQFPGGRSMLVDAGGAGGSEFDIGGRVIAPALWALGVRRLDYLVLTHGDADHVNGAVQIVRDFRPAEVWEGVPVVGHPLLEAIRQACDDRGGLWRRVVRGDRIEIGTAVVDVRHPAEPDWERQRVRNDDSVVVEIRNGDTAMLLPGDIEASGERAVAPVLVPVARRVLLAPHHGSATSLGDGLLGSARPWAAVVSAGRGNRYGHPHRSTLERLERGAVPVYRTDVDGAVTVELTGAGIRIRTWRSVRQP